MENSLRLDVKQVIVSKMPRASRFIPEFVFRKLARIIRQDELNRISGENVGKEGPDFARGVMESLDIKLSCKGVENLPSEGRYVFASNHLLGGLDGMALLSFLCDRYDNRVKCIVNDVLMAIKPLRSVFLPINKYGSQSREAMKRVEEAYAGDEQILMFPAGLCSRMNDKGEVCDLEWQKSFITKSVETKRDVIPVYFEGLNSKFFYRFARIRKRLGIKFNIELIFLPAEMVDAKGKSFTFHFGKPIPYTTFDNSRSKKEWAAYVKSVVYSLAEKK